VVLAYDPLGRLHQVSSTAGPTTAFLYDGDALIAEYVSGVMTRRYVHNVGADVPLLSYQGATLSLPSYLHADHQGSIVAISDASGNGAINSYDEYGIPGATNTGRFQYTGQAWLPELGMYYYKARIYSATLGRFLQTDPIGYRGGMNAYAYVRNNPVNFRDPLGLCSFTLMGHYEAPQGPDGRPSGPWDLKYTFVEQNTACESSYTSMVTPAALTEFGWANMDGDGDRQDSCRLDPGPVNFSGYLMATPAGPGHIGGTFYNMATGQRGTVATGSGYTFGLAGGMYSINATFNNIASFTQGFEFSYAFGFGAGGDITIYSLDQQFIAIGQISSGFSPPFGIAKASMDGGTIRSVNGHRC
jgi:RHS repeat-associated protein